MPTLLRTLPLVALLALAACGAPAVPGDSTSSASSAASVSGVDIQVSQPLAQSRVTSPLTVSGTARGTWFFEASFPVSLLDANGNVLAQAPAQAQGDWMTTDMVPFTVTLTFTPPASGQGMLVLKKDNPSGLPQNDASVQVPVTF